jgi:RimJ/RimL family protein N-acetyltransferase
LPARVRFPPEAENHDILRRVDHRQAMLIGKSICLGPVLHGDAALLFNWHNNAGLARSNGPYRPTDQAKFDAWLGGIGADPTRVVFAIRSKQDVRLLGYLQIINIQPVPRTAELGILIGDKADQDQGFGQEAMNLALDFCWKDLNLQRVTLFVVGENPRAIHVYAKLGFAVEGTMRRAAYIDGQFHDVTIMGILRLQDEPALAAWRDEPQA